MPEAMNAEMQRLIDDLKLIPHPEGGYCRETYRSAGVIPAAALRGRFPGERRFGTAIYFLIGGGSFSAFHRIRQDEVWHFYRGETLSLFELDEQGTLRHHKMGSDAASGELPQVVVRGGSWFAAAVDAKDAFALAGCTVAPEFEFADLEMASRAQLTALFPQHAGLIRRFTRF
jgi:predicted cupin superfamily sugar epimerase